MSDKMASNAVSLGLTKLTCRSESVSKGIDFIDSG